MKPLPSYAASFYLATQPCRYDFSQLEFEKLTEASMDLKQATKLLSIEVDAPILPEHNLLQAVLERAIREASGIVIVERPIFTEAFIWVFSDEIEPWTFRWICNELDFSEKTIELFRSRVVQTLAERSSLSTQLYTFSKERLSEHRKYLTDQHTQLGSNKEPSTVPL